MVIIVRERKGKRERERERERERKRKRESVKEPKIIKLIAHRKLITRSLLCICDKKS